MNPSKPRKYSGQDDLEKFNEWLSHLLKYHCTFKVTKPDCDEDQVLYTRLYLEGLTSQWYDQVIDSLDWQVQDWMVKDIICELFQQFVNETSV